MTPQTQSIDAGLPKGWSARSPQPDDVAGLVAMVAQHRQAMTGSGSLDPEAIRSEAVGVGSWTRRQLLITDTDGAVVAWIRAHDRARGRTGVELLMADDLAEADPADR